MARVKGDPRRNIVDALRLWFYLEFVSKEAGIKKTGYQLEQYFQPDNMKKPDDAEFLRRNGKWERLVALKTFPSEATIRLIEQRLPGARYYLEMPLWEALQPKPKSNKEWVLFYRKLRPALCNAALSLTTDNDHAVRVKHVRSKALDDILFEGDVDALACSIALFRHAKTSGAGVYACRQIEWKINALLFGVLNHWPFYNHKLVFYKAFKKFVMSEKDGNFLFPPMWDYSDEDFHLKSQIQNSILLIAEDIGLIRPIRERQYFLYLVRKSDQFSVYQELNEAKQVKQWQVKKSKDGLEWVIRKLNRKRPPSKQIGPQI